MCLCAVTYENQFCHWYALRLLSTVCVNHGARAEITLKKHYTFEKKLPVNNSNKEKRPAIPQLFLLQEQEARPAITVKVSVGWPGSCSRCSQQLPELLRQDKVLLTSPPAHGVSYSVILHLLWKASNPKQILKAVLRRVEHNLERFGFGPQCPAVPEVWEGVFGYSCSSWEDRVAISIVWQPAKLPQGVFILALSGIIRFPLPPIYSLCIRSPVLEEGLVLHCQFLLCELAGYSHQFSCYPTKRLAP